MKRIIYSFSFLLLGMLILSGCEKDENRIQFEGGTAPVLTASKTAVRLTPATESETAIVFNWTNPNFRFNTGVSSQDVNYTLEIDTAGGNFNSARKFSTTIAKELRRSYTEKELNDILGNDMRLTSGRQYNLQARVVASVGSSTGTALPSNTISFTATPFTPPPKVQPPSTGELYIVGDATPGGWANPVPVPSQKFTRLSPTLFEITVPLSSSGKYLFLPQNGSWDSKYAVENNGLTGLGDTGGGFRFYTAGGQDMPGPSTSGTYKITVNFQSGEYTVVKQ